MVFFNDTATTEIYTLSLHDALPISLQRSRDPPIPSRGEHGRPGARGEARHGHPSDQSHGAAAHRAWIPRRSVHGRALQIGRATRLNSSHANISYAVFCLKKKTRRI